MATLTLVLPPEPTKQQLVDYANAAALVNNYAFAITQTSLPVLNIPPPNYADFAKEFAPAKAHALTWTGSVFPQMLSLPDIIINAEALINLDETMVGQYLQILQSDPSNQQAKNGLATALKGMLTIIQQQQAAVQSIQSGVSTFSAQVITDASTLSDIAGQALADAGADQDKINQLNQAIDGLNKDIQTQNTLLTISAIGIGVSIFVGLIGAVVAFIPGAQGVGIGIIILGVGGVAASIAGTVIASLAIKADQEAIASDQKQIAELHQDIILLQGVNKQFLYLVQANAEAQKALAVVAQMWNGLEDVVSEMVSELTATETAVEAQQYADALADFEQAEAAWTEIVDFAKALKGIDYKWQDAKGDWHSFTESQPAPGGATVTQIAQAA